TQPQGMPTHAEFVAGVREALDHVRTHHEGAVLLVSSGGPIATAVAEVLGAPRQAAIELNMRIRNSAVTEFVFSEKRHSLLSFNTLPHLQGAAHTGWVTYS
ncbi:MAG: histidine phosphatase family protein, partial [Piscinibacter sp.]|uniref:histidine phosphatase family protein n=1 Tax=Piscinibacter sp. TaxID=1903157 RepID=UPI003D0EDE7D